MDLGQKLRQTLAKLTNQPYVDESAVKSLIKDLQRVLISSDVDVRLVLQLSKKIEERALKSDKLQALSLKEHVLKVVYEELVVLMGHTYQPRLDKHRILLCGLFGSGKTTSVGKLAHFYKSKGLSVGVVAADVDRPAAQEQLEQLSKKVNSHFYTTKGEKNASKIVRDALSKAKEDVIIVDSAGRSAFDGPLVDELKSIATELHPDETYLVISGDIGQVAGKQARQFNEAVPLSGVIATKMDGSGKGGGALSAVAATGTKISFIGLGEKMEDLQIYNAEKFVGRLLGVPDIEGLLEKIKTVATEQNLKEVDMERLTFESFYEQLKAAKKLGPLSSVFSMLGAADVPKEIVQESEGKLKKYESMINSMTKAEKKDPQLIKSSKARIDRVARGSGCTEKDVRDFIAQFNKMEKMMGMFRKNRGFRKKMEQMMKGGGLPQNIKLN